jgi:hypothetical protein
MADAGPLGAPLVDVGPAIDKALDAWAQNVQARPSLARRCFSLALASRACVARVCLRVRAGRPRRRCVRAVRVRRAPSWRVCAEALCSHGVRSLRGTLRFLLARSPSLEQPRVKQVVNKLAAPREIVEDTQAWVKAKAPAARCV